MHLNIDAHYEYALDRQNRLRAEAAAHRLVHRTPLGTRLDRLVCRLAGRVDRPAAACRRVRRDTAAEHI